jgi:cell wall-associated NlpC family hydrolase
VTVRAPLGLLTVLVGVLLAVGPAAADPSIEGKRAEAQAVLDQIRGIDADLERAVESYNFANVQLQRIQGDLKANARHLVIAKSSLEHAQTHLSDRLVSLYMNGNGGTSTIEILLGANSLDDVLNRLDAVERVSNQDAEVLADVRAFKTEVKTRKAKLQKAQRDQKRVVAERVSQKRAVEARLASRQQLYSSIKGQIAQLEAAERRRSAQLAAQAQARVAAQGAGAVEQTESADLQELSSNVAPSQYGGVVGIAMQYLGVPYVWGGASPSGFDCSGFIMYVYAQLGVSLPHHAASQFSVGTPVSRDQLEAGDLVFFNGLGHAGIYIGGGNFVHAPHTGDVVKVSSLSQDWYSRTWVGGRRL